MDKGKGEGMKIAIISGRLEEVQVQLTLVNYLALWQQKEGEEAVQWQWFLEYTLEEKSLQDFDMACFVRGRTFKALQLMAYCKACEIQTIYILDDNWFCEEVIETIQCFKQCLMCSDHVFVYNDYVYEQAKAYHEQVHLFCPNVNLEHFKKVERVEDSIKIGFAGSESKRTFFEPVFKALWRHMEENKVIELYFKGIYLPVNFRVYQHRVHEESYVACYHRYAQQVGRWGCEVMISPLIETPYTRGKCPNKYLEITAMGAVGIYSDTSVYRQYVQHKKNGLLISHTEADWYSGIEYLVKNREEAKKMGVAAREDVETHYTTQVLLDFFIYKMRSILE